MRHVWLLATTLFITTEAHAFRHLTCDLLFQVRMDSCSPNAAPECRPEVLTADEERETIGEEPSVDIAFEVLDEGKPQFLLTKWSWDSKSETITYTYDEIRDRYVHPEYWETIHLTGYSENEVMRHTYADSSQIAIRTFECTEVK